jgi:hypothetical protein
VFRRSLSFRRVGVALVVVAAAVVANPAWSASLGIDVWNLPALQDQIAGEAAKSREFDRRDADVFRRIELKERLVADLIAGRVTLAEVTPQFLELNRDRPGYMLAIRASYPGRTDEERTARTVLQYAERQLAQFPSASHAAIAARLENEFSDLFPTSAAVE